MYRTTDYLDLAIDTQCLEPCLRSWNIRRWQSAAEKVNFEDSSSSGSSECQDGGQDKRPGVRFLLAPHQDQKVDTVDTVDTVDSPPAPATPATDAG